MHQTRRTQQRAGSFSPIKVQWFPADGRHATHRDGLCVCNCTEWSQSQQRPSSSIARNHDADPVGNVRILLFGFWCIAMRISRERVDCPKRSNPKKHYYGFLYNQPKRGALAWHDRQCGMGWDGLVGGGLINNHGFISWCLPKCPLPIYTHKHTAKTPQHHPASQTRQRCALLYIGKGRYREVEIVSFHLWETKSNTQIPKRMMMVRWRIPRAQCVWWFVVFLTHHLGPSPDVCVGNIIAQQNTQRPDTEREHCVDIFSHTRPVQVSVCVYEWMHHSKVIVGKLLSHNILFRNCGVGLFAGSSAYAQRAQITWVVIERIDLLFYIFQNGKPNTRRIVYIVGIYHFHSGLVWKEYLSQLNKKKSYKIQFYN